jgi:alkanesulfonate monooxygenase SsuD/methylene tetrahydromethanopterin reductase-like flavin-dependent oxidoreductase (luciferase family)
MKRLWTEEEPEFKGEFCSFSKGLLLSETAAKAAPPDYLWWRERAGTQAGG